ncbi:hypothetical protein EB077_14680 [bacterium]|nr:hypothetical protein [bacterium]
MELEHQNTSKTENDKKKLKEIKKINNLTKYKKKLSPNDYYKKHVVNELNFLFRQFEKEVRINTKKEEAGKAIRIRIYPDKTQKQTLSKWFGVRRWIYNKCLSEYKKGTTTIKELLIVIT